MQVCNFKKLQLYQIAADGIDLRNNKISRQTKNGVQQKSSKVIAVLVAFFTYHKL